MGKGMNHRARIYYFLDRHIYTPLILKTYMVLSVTPKIWTLSDKDHDFLPRPGDNFGTVVGENPTPYGLLALIVGCQWTVNCLLCTVLKGVQKFFSPLALPYI